MKAQTSIDVVLGIVEILNDLGIPYHLGGSFASSVHGIPRQTRDADFVIAVNAPQVRRLVSKIDGDFYVDETVALDAVKNRASFNAIHLDAGFKIDFFVKGDSAFDESEMERRVPESLLDDPKSLVFFKSCEDTILRKLQWFHEGGGVSDRQWTDVLGIIKTQGDLLNTIYLHSWAARLGLSSLLKKALEEAAP